MNLATAFRYWRKGIPRMRGNSHEILRGRHERGAVLVHGNGPSATAGLAWAQEHFGPALTVVGMNASGTVCAPNYYLILDSEALANYALRIDPAACRPVIQPSAFARITRRRARTQPDLDAHARILAAHPATLRLERDSQAHDAPLDPRIEHIVGATAGIAGVQLALLMLWPPLDESGQWEHPPRPGTLIVTGLDGYDLGTTRHINPAAEPFFDRDKMESINRAQDAHVRQAFELAAGHGLSVVNLSARGAMSANELHRVAAFDTA